MASSDLPLPPAVKPKRAKRRRKKKTASAAPGKHLSIIKSSAEREGLVKEKQVRTQRSEVPVGQKKIQTFQEVVSRASSKLSPRLRRRRGRGARARNVARLRILKFHLKFALRQARRFHRRFTFRQVLGFYIGVPAAISLILCLVFLLWTPPKSVTPDLVSSRKPSLIELIQQIQLALGAHNPRAAEAAAAGLREFYPTDPMTFVACGTVSAHEKNYDEARKSFRRALELVHGLPPALINLGEVEFAVGNYGQAANYYEQAGRSLPRNPLILFRRYLCYSLVNDRPKTEDMLRELNASPYSVEWYFIQASEAYRSGNRPEAKRLTSAATALFGERAMAYQESLKKLGWIK
jgi:tetratricopeptide (TPR) repeat protein